jgi:hypothetical protein
MPPGFLVMGDAATAFNPVYGAWPLLEVIEVLLLNNANVACPLLQACCLRCRGAASIKHPGITTAASTRLAPLGHPLAGQGITVAVLQAHALQQLLGARLEGADGDLGQALEGLPDVRPRPCLPASPYIVVYVFAANAAAPIHLRIWAVDVRRCCTGFHRLNLVARVSPVFLCRRSRPGWPRWRRCPGAWLSVRTASGPPPRPTLRWGSSGTGFVCAKGSHPVAYPGTGFMWERLAPCCFLIHATRDAYSFTTPLRTCLLVCRSPRRRRSCGPTLRQWHARRPGMLQVAIEVFVTCLWQRQLVLIVGCFQLLNKMLSFAQQPPPSKL